LLFSFSVSLSSHAYSRHESSVGILSTSGNTEVSSVAAKHESALDWDKDTLGVRAGFTRASNQGVETASIWDFGTTYGRKIGPRYSLTLGEIIEGNRFQNLLQRYSTDAGLRYEFEKEGWSAGALIGYRFSRENYPVGSSDFHLARIRVSGARAFTPEISLSALLELLPNFTRSEAWQANSEIGVVTQFSSVFSLKSDFRWRYYHTPPAGVRYRGDTALTTALVARF
jgi:hypothetical protein